MLITISDKVRIEDSPPRKRAVATKELLDNKVTAGHYQATRTATEEEVADPAIDTKDGKRRFPDAHGKPIEIGQEMDYIDWQCRAEERVWNVYQLQDLTRKAKKGPDITVPTFVPVGSFPTLEEANAFALTL